MEFLPTHKGWKIRGHLKQVERNRKLIGDMTTPVNRLKRPPGMKKYLWERRIAYVRYHEREADRLFKAGILKYMGQKGSHFPKEVKNGIKK